MSARSLLCSCVVVACGKTADAPKKPTADPAKVHALAVEMVKNVPAMAAVPECEDAQLAGGATMTYRTVQELAGEKIPNDPEHAAWINPPALDAPGARKLAGGAADREAAGELLAAPFYVVYRVDMVNAPVALAIKELKIGTVGVRVIRYDKAGRAICERPFYFQNDQAKSDWAIAHSTHVMIDPEVAEAMRVDLAEQFVKQAPRGAGSAGSAKAN